MMNEHHVSGLPVVGEAGELVGVLSQQDLMVRESGFDAGPYVMLDVVIYLRSPLQWDRQVHQVLGSTVADVMGSHPHSCSTQRLFAHDDQRRRGRGHLRIRGRGARRGAAEWFRSRTASGAGRRVPGSRRAPEPAPCRRD